MTERPYFSIGEVLGLLLEEFADVTISKIRFLESQGLIDPERTSSGYRKFYDADVERLRYILREQKDHYLPLKVIKERLDGIDHTLPNPPRPMPIGASWATAGETGIELTAAGEHTGEAAALHAAALHDAPVDHTSVDVVTVDATFVELQITADGLGEPTGISVSEITVSETSVSELTGRDRHGRDRAIEAAVEASGANGDRAGAAPERIHLLADPSGWIERSPTPPHGVRRRSAPAAPAEPLESSTDIPAARPAALLKVVRDGDAPPPADLQLTAAELCEAAEIEPATLRQLEEFGLLAGRALGTDTAYGPEALQVARIARRLLAAGLEVRHLRTWRMAAEKEASLFEQLVVPLLRQRNPNARQHAIATLTDLTELGGDLRALLVRAALSHHFDR